MKLSVVIPCYYSEATIGQVVRQTREELVKHGFECEFILVNDGSSDGTYACIQELCNELPNVFGIDLMQNFGQHNAIMAGLQYVTGDAVLLMDDDMQTHPSQCNTLVNAYLTSSADVVFAVYFSQKKSLIRGAGSRFALFTERVLAGCPKDIEDSSFFIMSRKVSDELVKYKGSSVYIQGLIFRTTNRIENVAVEHFAREYGESGYTLRSLFSLWSTILNFSVTPLRFSTALGVLVAVVGIVGAIILLVQRLFDPEMVLGWASTMVTILVCSGLVMLCLGVVGEYVGRLFMMSTVKPQFIIRDNAGCSRPDREENER